MLKGRRKVQMNGVKYPAILMQIAQCASSDTASRGCSAVAVHPQEFSLIDFSHYKPPYIKLFQALSHLSIHATNYPASTSLEVLQRFFILVSQVHQPCLSHSMSIIRGHSGIFVITGVRNANGSSSVSVMLAGKYHLNFYN